MLLFIMTSNGFNKKIDRTQLMHMRNKDAHSHCTIRASWDLHFTFNQKCSLNRRRKRKKGMFWANAMKRVVVGAHLLTPWIFEPAKRPDDRADYCLDNRQQS